MEAPNFWDDPVVSQKKMKELKSMKDDVATYASLKTEFEDIETLIEMGYEENDASLIPEIQEMLDEFTKTYEGIRIKTLLSGEYDSMVRSSHCMQEPEARSPVTGRQCFTACIQDGHRTKDFLWRF